MSSKMKSRKLWLSVIAVILPVLSRAIWPDIETAEVGGLDLSLSGNTDRWSGSLAARHRVGRELDATASVLAGADWGETPEWKALVGLKWRW